jgi:hypothetical protein
MDTLKSTILSRYDSADNYLSSKRSLWDEYENLFAGVLNDDLSDTTKSQVFDNKLGTFILEREYRVMAQLMAGKVKAVSKNDEGASKLMNLILEKYIIPNANAQFDFMTKCRMMDRYSNIYGNFFGMVDWDVRKNGYVGPDLWLLNIRDVFPQVGAVSVEDSDYIIVRSWRKISFFENLGKREGFKNVSKIIEKLKDISGDKSGRDSKDKSQRELNEYPSETEAKGRGYYSVWSMFERDRWVDYVPAADEILRDTKNPHDNDELPIVNKYSIPLLDDFMAMGDSERGKSMQYTVNSLFNLYLDAQKMSIFPPVMINKDAIADAKSIKFSPAAKWLIRGQLANAAQTLNLSPQSQTTFNNAYQVTSASLMNMFGTSTTQTTAETTPEFGKTPQALKMQENRENSRDNADKFYMEQFLTSTVKKFINLVSKKQSSALTLRMFQPEIDELARTYPEVKEMYDSEKGKLTINKSTIGKTLYDYEIVPGSTYQIDEAKQQANSVQLLTLLMQSPQLAQTLAQENKELHIGELLNVIFAKNIGQGYEKIIVDKTGDEIMEQALSPLQQLQDQLQMGNIPATPPGNPQSPLAQPPMAPQQPMPPQGQPSGGMPPMGGMM